MPAPRYLQVDNYLEDRGWEVCWFDDIHVRFCLPGKDEDYSHIDGPFQPWKNSLVLVLGSTKGEEEVSLLGKAIEIIAEIENRPAIDIYNDILTMEGHWKGNSG